MRKQWLLISGFTLALVSGPVMAGGDVAAGEAKAAEACAGCHGAAGEGMGDNPALAGLDKKEHAHMLMGYKDGSREGAMMQMFAGQLSEEDIWNLAAYYASLGE